MEIECGIKFYETRFYVNIKEWLKVKHFIQFYYEDCWRQPCDTSCTPRMLIRRDEKNVLMHVFFIGLAQWELKQYSTGIIRQKWVWHSYITLMYTCLKECYPQCQHLVKEPKANWDNEKDSNPILRMLRFFNASQSCKNSQ